MLILSSGALVNVALNFILIPILGIEGAAVATLIGYVVSDIICVLVLCKMKLMVISKRFVFTVLLTTAYFVIWRLFIPTNAILGLVLAVSFTAAVAIIYKKDLIGLVKGIRKSEQ